MAIKWHRATYQMVADEILETKTEILQNGWTRVAEQHRYEHVMQLQDRFARRFASRDNRDCVCAFSSAPPGDDGVRLRRDARTTGAICRHSDARISKPKVE